jgi:hypothetical protein
MRRQGIDGQDEHPGNSSVVAPSGHNLNPRLMSI